MRGLGNSRRIVFVALMAALGNSMFIVSQTIFKAGQVTLDLSHIGTFIAAVYGGPWIGLLTGLFVGIGPGMYYGYVGGSLGLLGLIGLPIGKALTGLTVGFLARIFKTNSTKYSSWKVTAATLVGYVPEAVFTIFFFVTLVPTLLPDVAAFFGNIYALVISIMAKAWIEIALLSVFMGILVGNNGFSDFVDGVLKTANTLKLRTHKPE